MKNILFFLILYLCRVSSEAEWRYGWKCSKENTCQSDWISPVLDQPVYDTLAICRLTCGKYGALWPLPTGETQIGKKFLRFHPNSIDYIFPTAQGEALKFLNEMKNIFHDNLMYECDSDCIEEADTTVDVYAEALHSNHDVQLIHETDESYNVSVYYDVERLKVTVGISARNVYGLRHGFETLSQLIAPYYTPAVNGKQVQYGLVIVTEAKIEDKPTYKYRGLLLDTSRNFLPVKAIKRQLDAMAASKMNVFHWHATDSQSFPLEVPIVANLSRYGAYSPEEIYTKSDIADIRAYARVRGVRLVMEIDTPSHAGFGWQWGEQAGLGVLAACVNRQPWRQYCIQPPCGQLNPANPNVYKVLKKLYKGLSSVLENEEWFHMGGDEVFFPCWNSTEEIVRYMESKGLGRTTKDFLDLWSEFQSKALKAFDAVSTKEVPIMLWSSHLTDPEYIESYLPPERYIIETWVPSSDPLPNQLLDKGYRLVVSTKDAWYLDHGFHGWTQYHTWRDAYNNKLPNRDNVLGGEACMWGELVDETQLDSKVWPRTAAAAERLWSNPTSRDGEAEPRFYRHRERLVTRGLDAESLSPSWCLHNERQCG